MPRMTDSTSFLTDGMFIKYKYEKGTHKEIRQLSARQCFG